MTAEWRTRWTRAQTRGRTLERQAEGLRLALVRRCDGTGPAADVERYVGAITEQLELVKQMAVEWNR